MRHDRWHVFFYALVGATIFWLLLNPPWKVIAAGYTVEQWLFLLVFSVITILLPFSCYFAGLQYLDPTRAIVTSCLEPVFAIILAGILLGEEHGWIQSLGMLVVVAGTVIVQLPEKSARAAMDQEA